MNLVCFRFSRQACAFVIALVAVCGLSAPPASAQKQKPAPEKPSTERHVLKIFQLKSLDPTEAVRIIQETFGQPWGQLVRITADPQGKSVIAWGQAEDITLIEALISKLDVDRPQAAQDENRLWTIQLRGPTQDRALEEMLKLISGRTNKFAVDRQRNIVFVYGDAKMYQLANEAIREMDRPPPPAPPKVTPQEVQVRVVWLVSGLEKKEAVTPPDDLKEVVAELAKLGVKDPKLVSQTIVNAMAGSQFQAYGTANLDPPTRLLIAGTLVEKAGEAPSLQISIDATRDGPGGDGFNNFGGVRGSGGGSRSGNQVCRLDTQITAPPGHMVVLGVTPTQTMTSVFVVQVLPRKSTPSK